MRMPLPFKLASLTLFAAFALCATDFSLSDQTKVGTVVLPVGGYWLGVQGHSPLLRNGVREIRHHSGEERYGRR